MAGLHGQALQSQPFRKQNYMNILFVISLGLAMLSVLAVLVVGLVAMIKGGEFNAKYGNKLMQARVYLQGLALGLLALAYFASQSG